MSDSMEIEDEATVKRNSSEQRKLRSRDAARCRRSQETEVFYELAQSLPLPRRVSSHLDKAAIMRVTLSFLRIRCLFQPSDKKNVSEEVEDDNPMDSFYPQALAGFVMVMTEEGDVIYLTDNVSRHIGINQLELLGQSVYDFVHPCDQDELRDLLSPRPASAKKQPSAQVSERNFFLRLKSTLTSRGRTVNLKCAAWKVFHCTGHMRPFRSTSPPAARVMTLLCEPVPHPSSVEFPLDTSTFLTRHSMDLHFTHCEGRVTELVGYKPEDLIGRSAFQYHHALDSNHINKSLHTLLSKGQVTTSRYRFLASSGGFVWAETQATVLYSSRTSQPEAVVCLNFVLSAVEQPHIVFSTEQIRCDSRPVQEAPAEDCWTSDVCEDTASAPSSTAEVPLHLKEDAELLQLAPNAGDTIVPLTGFTELSFAQPVSPNSVPDQPEDLCTPELLQLLSPIFNPFASPSSSSSPPDCSPGHELVSNPQQKDMMDNMEKVFTVCPENDEHQTLEDSEGTDLDMFAPYISMDDDFQLTSFSWPEPTDRPLPSSPEPAGLTPVGTVSRKRTRVVDEEMMSQLMIQEKRQKHSPSSSDEDVRLSQSLLDVCGHFEHGALGRMEDMGQTDLALNPGGRSPTTDPVVGGLQGLYDTAALMMDIFAPLPPDRSPPPSAMT